MTDAIFKKTIFFSLLGHLTLFGIFSFSFGYRIPRANYSRLTFLGGILESSDFLPFQNLRGGKIKKAFMRGPDTAPLEKINQGQHLVSHAYLKPSVGLVSQEEKIFFVPPPDYRALPAARKERTIMFYPRLPYNFLLYFQDRQTVHIELMFNVASRKDKASSITMRRKTSSGNLEADLLVMRYLSHYFFIQQAGFLPNNWQTVKIDLSTENDQP